MKGTLYVRMPEDLKVFIEAQAEAYGLSVNAYVIMIFQQIRKEEHNEH